MTLKLFKKQKSFRKGGLHIDPNICWKYILFATFTIILLSFAFSFFLFLEVNKSSPVSSAPATSTLDQISGERIDKALEYFRNRQTKSSEILNSPSPLVDPSI